MYYVKHNLRVFQCLCSLYNDSYIDYTFKDKPIIESEIIDFNYIFSTFSIQNIIFCSYKEIIVEGDFLSVFAAL